MVGGYRSLSQGVAPRADDVRWRVRVAKAVWILIALFVSSALVGVVVWFVQVHVLEESPPERRVEVLETPWLKIVPAILGLVFSAGEAACAWVMTAPRPSAKTSPAIQAWVLRGFATASAVSFILRLALPKLFALAHEDDGLLDHIDRVVEICLAPAGLWFVSALFRELGLPKRAHTARTLALGLAAMYGVALWGGGGSVLMLVALGFICWSVVHGFVLVVAVGHALRVARHEWWVDVGDVSSPNWASLVVSGQGLAEVMMAGGERTDFASKSDAEVRLKERGFVHGKHAVTQGAVNQLPPSPI